MKTLPTPIIVLAEIAKSGMPQTQRDVCLLGARAAAVMCDPPVSDEDVLCRAWALAKGLLGDHWSTMRAGDRWTWIDMCEEAIREAVADQKPP